MVSPAGRLASLHGSSQNRPEAKARDPGGALHWPGRTVSRLERRPWSPFYWADWLADPAVRLLGDARRGRYIDFLAMTNQTERPGRHTEEEVREMLGYSPENWPDHRAAFLRCFRVTKGGLWIQKRTVEQFEASEKERKRWSELGRKGGLAKRAASTDKLAWLAPRCSVKPTQPESESEEEEEAPPLSSVSLESTPTPLVNGAARLVDREWREAFAEHFWPGYPRKVARKAAIKAWLAIGKSRTYDQLELLLGRIVAGLTRSVEIEWNGRDRDKIPHPATWLNSERWEDEHEAENRIGR